VLTKCRKMQEKAKALIPGMTQLLSKRPDRFSYGIWPGYFSRAKGTDVWDLDGNRYQDMSLAGIGANVLGYADSDVDDAVKDAIERGTSCTLNCPEEVELAERLCLLHPWSQMARFARSGGEAMAMAIRIARAHTGRDRVAFCGYHGWHDWYLAANLEGKDRLDEHLISGLSPKGVPRGLQGTALPFRYNRLDDLRTIMNRHGGDIAAVVMEPIRNLRPEKDFVEGVREMSRRHGALLIIDEISAGFRLTCGGAHLLLFPQPPDMAVFSKALGNGYPIAAVIGTAEAMSSAQDTFISSTNWTERIGPVAALATLRKHEEQNVADHLQAIGSRIRSGWADCAARHGLAVHTGGIDPMVHFTLSDDHWLEWKAYFIQQMLGRGFLASNHFYAMYAHDRKTVDRYLRSVDDIFAEIAALKSKGLQRPRLTGEPSQPGFQRLN
jgi:glutamate-1-semialdehyde 2,1-aminomutase